MQYALTLINAKCIFISISNQAEAAGDPLPNYRPPRQGRQPMQAKTDEPKDICSERFARHTARREREMLARRKVTSSEIAGIEAHAKILIGEYG